MTAVQDVEAYLAALPDDARESLEKLRTAIRAAAPDATEGISYQVPTFKYHGVLVAFGAGKKHCSFYVTSPSLLESVKDELAGYNTAKGTIHFPAGEALPEELVTRLVKARIEENTARHRTSKGRNTAVQGADPAVAGSRT